MGKFRDDQPPPQTIYEGTPQVGDWMDLAYGKHYGSKKKYSLADVINHNTFQAAMKGDLPAIREIIKMLEENMEAHRRLSIHVVRDDRSWLRLFYPSADLDQRERFELRVVPALLILGICGFDDASIRRFREPGSKHFDSELLMRRPDFVEEWVYEFACAYSGEERETKSGVPSHMTKSRCEPTASREMWDSNRQRLVEHLVRLRGPGASRFQKSRSGNPRGRPSKTRWRDGLEPGSYPHEGFLSEIVTVRRGDLEVRVPRLDACMYYFVTQASKETDEKIVRVVRPVIRKYEKYWNELQAEARSAPKIVSDYNGSAYDELRKLGCVNERAKTRFLLKPNLIDCALARIEQPLSPDEQEVVMRVVARSQTVNWPSWWVVGTKGAGTDGLG